MSTQIISEGSVAAGVRRIEAVAGASAAEVLLERDRALQKLTSMLKVQYDDTSSAAY